MKIALVSITLKRASGRDVLSGIFRRLESARGWNLRIFQEEDNPLTVGTFQSALADGIDGIIITKALSSELMDAIDRCDLPTVGVGIGKFLLCHHRRLSLVANDATGIGKLAAAHLTSRGGLAAFGFVGTPWSEERENAFRREIERLGHPFRPFVQRGEPGTDADKAALAEYLAQLPKPAGILAAADWRAAQVMDVSAKLGIAIPSEIAVLGVDNDEFICPRTEPPLSSIHPGHFEMGERAMSELIRLSNARKRTSSPRLTIVPTKRILIRESTGVRMTGAALVSRAKRFIADNACRKIGVHDVAQSLHVSYRLAELRFKEMEKITLREAIENVRLDNVRRLLVHTDLKIARIADECGFDDPNRLSHVFKKRTGQSLRDYRNAARSRTRS